MSDVLTSSAMADDSSDPFAKFAATHGLCISAQELVASPRDVLEPPADSDRYVLVALTCARTDVDQLQTLFVSEATDPRGPSIRDVLWWLASDSWAVEHARQAYADWAGVYGYADDDPAAMRRFELHVKQAGRLAHLLGDEAYASLLELYKAHVAPSV